MYKIEDCRELNTFRDKMDLKSNFKQIYTEFQGAMKIAGTNQHSFFQQIFTGIPRQKLHI